MIDNDDSSRIGKHPRPLSRSMGSVGLLAVQHAPAPGAVQMQCQPARHMTRTTRVQPKHPRPPCVHCHFNISMVYIVFVVFYLQDKHMLVFSVHSCIHFVGIFCPLACRRAAISTIMAIQPVGFVLFLPMPTFFFGKPHAHIFPSVLLHGCNAMQCTPWRQAWTMFL